MKLDQRVTHRRETTTSDGMGGNTEVVANVKILWANVKIVGARETVTGQRNTATATYVFKFRNSSLSQAILESDRLKWQGVEYNIRKIDDLGPREMYLGIEAERGAAQ